jgi:hypothetical protein
VASVVLRHAVLCVVLWGMVCCMVYCVVLCGVMWLNFVLCLCAMLFAVVLCAGSNVSENVKLWCGVVCFGMLGRVVCISCCVVRCVLCCVFSADNCCFCCKNEINSFLT